MPKEIFLYGGFNDFSGELFMDRMEEAKEEDILLRVNTNGGEPQSSYGLINKFQEHPKEKGIRVDGKAYSTGALLLAYADYVEALDVSQILIHRAAYPRWIESDPELFDDTRKKILGEINKSAKKALETKINAEKFKKITGKTLNDVFSMDNRIHVVLTAKEAKQIGLVDKIINITPKIKAEIDEHVYEIAASFTVEIEEEPEAEEQTENINLNLNTTMTLEELKSKHPEVYAQAFQAGQTEERDRTLAWMEFADVDIEAVKKGLSEGKNISQQAMAEFSRKLFSKQSLDALETESPEETETSAPESKEKTKTEKEHEEFLSEVSANLKSLSNE